MPKKRSATSLEKRYADWCSAKITERLLALPPEEMWRLRLRSEGRSAEEAGASERETRLSVDAPPDEIIQRLTLQLAAELHLPSFDEWVIAYRADPSFFERDILGFDERSSP